MTWETKITLLFVGILKVTEDKRWNKIRNPVLKRHGSGTLDVPGT
jgi:hypothetical protein